MAYRQRGSYYYDDEYRNQPFKYEDPYNPDGPSTYQSNDAGAKATNATTTTFKDVFKRMGGMNVAKNLGVPPMFQLSTKYASLDTSSEDNFEGRYKANDTEYANPDVRYQTKKPTSYITRRDVSGSKYDNRTRSSEEHTVDKDSEKEEPDADYGIISEMDNNQNRVDNENIKMSKVVMNNSTSITDAEGRDTKGIENQAYEGDIVDFKVSKTGSETYPFPMQELDSAVAKSKTRKVCIGVTVTLVALAVIGAAVGLAIHFTPGSDDIELVARWEQWGEWSSCSTTCGQGTEERRRDCTSPGGCGDDNEHIRSCGKACPRAADLYGTWSRWGEWTPCSSTCGNFGYKKRSRTCTLRNGIPCIGNQEQTLSCPGGDCPDCQRTCDTGKLSDDCTYCSCSDTSLSARVVSVHDGPIPGVGVSFDNITGVTANTTDGTGNFELTSICDGQMITIHASGYIPNYTEMEDGKSYVLRKIERLGMKSEPLGKSRLVGSCVELECDVMGYPPPDVFEWTRDGLQLPGEQNSTLLIENLQTSDAGMYRCRASNDYGAIFSMEAEIKVKDTSDEFCISTPLSQNQTLPTDCKYNGEPVVNIKRCASGICSLNKLESDCKNESRGRCGATEYVSVTIVCEGSEFKLPTVKNCGCVDEVVPEEAVEIELNGQVVNVNGTEIPDVYVKTVGLDTVTTGKYGDFKLNLPPRTSRVSLTLEDTRNRYSTSIIVVDISEDDEGYKEVEVQMELRPLPLIKAVKLDQPLSLSIGESDSDDTSFASIVIPANSLIDPDGTAYSGDVKVVVDDFNPSVDGDVLTAPGDFSAVNEDGEEQRLESTGMLRMNIQTSDDKPLALTGDITLTPNQNNVQIRNIANNDSPTRLWSMNPSTGRWEFAADMQSVSAKGVSAKQNVNQFTIRGIDIDREWYNFDYVQDQICMSKIRVYETNEFKEEDQMLYARPSVITLPSKDSPGTSVSKRRAWTDHWSGSNGYCIIHTCNSPRSSTKHDYNGYVLADHQSKPMKPNPNNNFNEAVNYKIDTERNFIEARFDLEIHQPHPYYDWDWYWGESQACSHASIDEPHFKFYKREVDICSPEEMTIIPNTHRPTPNDNNYLLWYPTFSSVPHITSCYIKVLVDLPYRNNVKAESKMGANEANRRIGELFGMRQECMGSDTEAICVEVRPAVGITNGDNRSSAKTYVDISLLSAVMPNHKLVNPTLGMETDGIDVNNKKLFKLQLIYGKIYGPQNGIYCSSQRNVKNAKRRADNMCRRGSSDDGGSKPPAMTSSGWAVYFSEKGTVPTPASTTTPTPEKSSQAASTQGPGQTNDFTVVDNVTIPWSPEQTDTFNVSANVTNSENSEQTHAFTSADNSTFPWVAEQTNSIAISDNPWQTDPVTEGNGQPTATMPAAVDTDPIDTTSNTGNTDEANTDQMFSDLDMNVTTAREETIPVTDLDAIVTRTNEITGQSDVVTTQAENTDQTNSVTELDENLTVTVSASVDTEPTFLISNPENIVEASTDPLLSDPDIGVTTAPMLNISQTTLVEDLTQTDPADFTTNPDLTTDDLDATTDLP